jgi:putative endonuclease
MPYYVYILECSNKALYTGITTDIDRRFAEHKRGKGGHYTTSNPPVKIRYTEEYPSRSSATKREAQIKAWSRTKKLALLKGDKGILKTAARCKNNSCACPERLVPSGVEGSRRGQLGEFFSNGFSS